MKGLLLYPEFPASSFWSYRHIMPMVGAKAAFPPLGLLTFAALMPAHWEFELVDLNVDHPSDDGLHARIAEEVLYPASILLGEYVRVTHDAKSGTVRHSKP